MVDQKHGAGDRRRVLVLRYECARLHSSPLLTSVHDEDDGVQPDLQTGMLKSSPASAAAKRAPKLLAPGSAGRIGIAEMSMALNDS